jgi:hypothetical protein
MGKVKDIPSDVITITKEQYDEMNRPKVIEISQNKAKQLKKQHPIAPPPGATLH